MYTTLEPTNLEENQETVCPQNLMILQYEIYS